MAVFLSVVGMGYLRTTKVNVPSKQCRPEKKTHTVRNIEWLNLGLNTMVTGHTELIVIFLNPFWELHT